jgi:hypothetical protein
MLTNKIKSNIQKVDFLTDFDRCMIKEESPYKQVFAYFLYLHGFTRMNFLKESIKKYKDYKESGNVSIFYSLFAGCPVEVLDKTVEKYNQNKKWNSLVENLKIGIVSRNSSRIISKYLNLNSEKFKEQNSEINIVAANKPEIEDNVCTGNVELIVNNSDLVDYVKEKDYICGDDEKKILDDSGIHSMKLGNGLYICSKQKIF